MFTEREFAGYKHLYENYALVTKKEIRRLEKLLDAYAEASNLNACMEAEYGYYSSEHKRDYFSSLKDSSYEFENFKLFINSNADFILYNYETEQFEDISESKLHNIIEASKYKKELKCKDYEHYKAYVLANEIAVA
jgi:hypothetical protein